VSRSKTAVKKRQTTLFLQQKKICFSLVQTPPETQKYFLSPIELIFGTYMHSAMEKPKIKAVLFLKKVYDCWSRTSDRRTDRLRLHHCAIDANFGVLRCAIILKILFDAEKNSASNCGDFINCRELPPNNIFQKTLKNRVFPGKLQFFMGKRFSKVGFSESPYFFTYNRIKIEILKKSFNFYSIPLFAFFWLKKNAGNTGV
jgi:hypothetical protein